MRGGSAEWTADRPVEVQRMGGCYPPSGPTELDIVWRCWAFCLRRWARVLRGAMKSDGVTGVVPGVVTGVVPGVMDACGSSCDMLRDMARSLGRAGRPELAGASLLLLLLILQRGADAPEAREGGFSCKGWSGWEEVPPEVPLIRLVRGSDSWSNRESDTDIPVERLIAEPRWTDEADEELRNDDGETPGVDDLWSRWMGIVGIRSVRLRRPPDKPDGPPNTADVDCVIRSSPVRSTLTLTILLIAYFWVDLRFSIESISFWFRIFLPLQSG